MNQSQINFIVKTLGADEAAREFTKIERAAQKAGSTVKQYLKTSAGESELIGLQSRAAAARAEQASATDRVTSATDRVADATDRAGRSQAGYFAHIARTTIQSALINKLFLEFVDVAGQAVQQVDLMNNFPATMASMGASTKDATEAMDTLRSYVGQVGGNLGDATSYVTRFVSAVGDVKAATAVFVGLNNALIAGDSSMQEQRLAAVQFAQALERGKPDMREWMSLTQNMSFQLGMVAKSMGYVSANELGEALTQGKESMAAFTTELTKLATGTGPIVTQAMARMNGMQFSFNVLKNTLVQGLAAIVDAIGRQNIVSFFSFLTQVVQVLTSVVVKLIGALVTLLNIFGSLFGLPAIKLKKDVEGVASGIGAGAGNAEDLAGGLGDAGKEAKKLNKTLAGFDKMNVLPEKESGSGGKGAGGAGAAGFDPGQMGQLGDMFGEIGNDLAEASKWAKIFAGILLGLAANALIEKIFGVNPIKEFLKWLATVPALLATIPGKVAAFAKGIVNSLSGWYGTAKQGISKFARDVVDNTRQAITEISLAWTILGPRIAEQFGKLKTGIMTVLDNLGVIDKFNEIRAGAIAIFSTLKDNAISQFELLKAMAVDKFESMKSGIYGQLQILAAQSGTLAGGIVRAIQEKFGPMATVVTAKFYEIKDVIYGQLQIAAMNAGIAANRIVFALYDTFGPLVEGVRTRFTQVKDAITTTISGIATTVATTFGQVKTAMIDGAGTAVSGVKAVFGSLADIGGTQIALMGASIKSGFDSYIAPIAGPVGAIGKLIGTGLVENLRSALLPVTTVASGSINGLKKVFGGAGKIVGDAFSSSMSSIGGAATRAGKAITDKLGISLRAGLMGLGAIITGGIVLAFREGPAAVTEAFNGFIQAVLNGPETVTSLIAAVQGMFATIAAQTEPIINAVMTMVSTIVNTLITDGPRMIETFFNLITQLIGKLTEGDTLSKMVTGTVDLLTKVVIGIANILPKIIETMINLVLKLIDTITQPEFLDKMITTTIDLLLKILVALIEALPKIIDGMIKLLVKLIDVITRPDILDKIINAGIQLIIALAVALIDAVPKLIGAAIKLIVALAKALWDNRQKILDAIKQIGEKIVSKFGEVDWIQLGKDLVKGLWNGISNMAGWIGEKIKGFGKGVMDGLKNFFGIKSPSRLMRDEIGSMLGEGIGIGIEKSTSDAVDAAKKSAESIVGAFGSINSKVGIEASNSLVSSVGAVSVETGDTEIDNSAWVDRLVRELTAKEQPLQLTVQVGEEKIVSQIIDLINEKTQMSGRNTIYV